MEVNAKISLKRNPASASQKGRILPDPVPTAARCAWSDQRHCVRSGCPAFCCGLWWKQLRRGSVKPHIHLHVYIGTQRWIEMEICRWISKGKRKLQLDQLIIISPGYLTLKECKTATPLNYIKVWFSSRLVLPGSLPSRR